MPTSTDRPARKKRLFAVAVVVALTFAFAACGGGSGGGSSTAAISIKNFAFTTTPVPAGATVTVRNNDAVTHTVTSDDGKFNVTVDAGKTATFTAPAAGTYKFHCNIHNYMHGTLTVT
jgi:plastocyanin